MEPPALDGGVDRLLAEILVHEASRRALREGAVDGVVAPDHEVDRGLRVGRRSGARDDVLRVVRRAGADVAVPRREAEELLRIGGRIAVEQRRSHRLVHGLEERIVLGQAELRGVAVQHGEILIDLAASLEDAAGLIDLGSRALAARDALVQRTPVDRGQTSADDDALTGGQVALLEHAILEDLVGLREELGDDGNLPVRVGALRPVGERQVAVGKSCHCVIPFVGLGVG